MTSPPNPTHTALHAAQAAHQRRDASVDQYRQAIDHALRSGWNYSQIAAALGITRQAIRQYHITN